MRQLLREIKRRRLQRYGEKHVTPEATRRAAQAMIDGIGRGFIAIERRWRVDLFEAEHRRIVEQLLSPASIPPLMSIRGQSYHEGDLSSTEAFERKERVLGVDASCRRWNGQ